MTDYRDAPGHNPAWHRTDRSFSNFEFIDRNFGSDAILRRVFSLARKLLFGGVLIEQLLESDCERLAADNADLAQARRDFEHTHVTRFSFFSGTDQQAPGEFLGYAVYRQDVYQTGTFGHVYEAVVPPARGPRENNFVHCTRRHEVNTACGRRTVDGVLYAQQNGVSFVCAHVALRSMLGCLLTRDVSYQEINALAGVQLGAAPDEWGLSPDQIEAVLRGLGFEPRIYVHEPGKLELPPGLEFQRLLYEFIESGRPALLGFELAPPNAVTPGSRHAIPIFGHTFNEDLWVPEAERHYFAHDRGFFPSESWLSSYLAHDDNFGPYVCLPRHYLRRDQFRLVIGIHPPLVVLPAVDAETIALDFCQQLALAPSRGIPWFDRFQAFTRSQLLVLRAQHIERSHYTAHVSGCRDGDQFDLEPSLHDALLASLPEHLWLVEVSAPELFPSTRAKFGEVLVDATNPDAAAALCAARLPGYVFRRDANGFTIDRTRLAGHTPLFNPRHS